MNPCGFYETHDDAWYNHCGQGKVEIVIDYKIDKTTKCVGPGVTWIGDSRDVDSAEPNGKTC